MHIKTYQNRATSQGFTLVEIMVALGVGMIVIASALELFSHAASASFTVTQRAEMQQNARAAINNIQYDLRTTGTSMPQGGIALPTGGTLGNSLFGCGTTQCYVNTNNYPGQVFYSLLPNTGAGITITGRQSDSITMAYVD